MVLVAALSWSEADTDERRSLSALSRTPLAYTVLLGGPLGALAKFWAAAAWDGVFVEDPRGWVGWWALAVLGGLQSIV